jgi:hypothetical protein
LRTVVDKALSKKTSTPGMSKALSIGITLGQPVLPMLVRFVIEIQITFKIKKHIVTGRSM